MCRSEQAAESYICDAEAQRKRETTSGGGYARAGEGCLSRRHYPSPRGSRRVATPGGETLNLYKAREGEGEAVLEAVPNCERAGRVDTG